MPKVSAIIVAGGCSARMKGIDKLFLRVGGRTVLERSVAVFAGHPEISEIVVAAGAQALEAARALLAGTPKLRAVVEGGATRTLSVQRALAACSADTEYIAIHDAARPFVRPALISRVLAAAVAYGAAAPGIPVVDTIKRVDGDETVVDTPDRAGLRAVSTPQIFEAVLYRAAIKGQTEALDDCQLLERLGRKVSVVPGDADNIKITTPQDIERARQLMGETAMRIGHGYDVHRLVQGRRLILGGVEIPYETGLLGHSDADALLHAVSDALLGAAALGDIGQHFPDNDERYRGADSLALLEQVAAMLRGAGWAVGNIDATVLAQAPRLRPYIDAMRENIARACGCAPQQVSVKATTEEGLGFTGDGSGIAAHAVALLRTL